MISTKEKVRANIYKKLLEEEKRRNKKISVLSLSLFVVGVFTGSSYNFIFNKSSVNTKMIAFNNIGNTSNSSTEKALTIDDLFQNDNLGNGKRDFSSEKLFVSDLQI